MKVNKWTLGLAAVGLVSLPTVMQAEEKMSPINTALASTVISGYANAAAQWNPGTGNANLPAYAYNTAGKQDGFSLNAVKLTIEKPLDEAQWAAGYKVDLMFGPDANAFDSAAGMANSSDFAVRQAYVALRAPVGNGLDFKLGVFDTVIGYESHDAGNNPNYTRSYGYSLEPMSHTGLLAAYRFNEIFAIQGGVANTMGSKINETAWPTKAESYKTYMASISLTAPESMGVLAGSTLYAGFVNGFNSGMAATGAPGSANGNQGNLYAGATLNTPVKGLRLGGSFDYLDIYSGSTTGANIYGDGMAWATAGYISYQLTEKLSLHGRGEYLNRSGADNVVAGYPDKILAGTATIQYDLWKNVLSRLEFRWDHAANSVNSYNGTVAGAPNRQNSYILAANVIYKF
jgi:hypothetical protein